MSASAVFVQDYRTELAKLASDSLAAGGPDKMLFYSWRVGEGGYQVVAGNKVPKTPSTSMSGIEALVDCATAVCAVSHAVTGGYAEFLFSGGEVTDDGAGTVTISVTLASSEASLDDTKSMLTGNCGNAPELFEIGVYDENGVLVIYGTFDEVVKISGKTVQFDIVVTY